MLRRRPRLNTRTAVVPLGGLDLSQGDYGVPDGALRDVHNLRPAGVAEGRYWTPVVPSTSFKVLPAQVDAVALGRYVTDTDTFLVAVTADTVYVVNTATGVTTPVHTYSAADSTRQATVTQVGNYGVIASATSVSATSIGAPDATVLLRETAGTVQALGLDLGDPPNVTATTPTPPSTAELEDGTYLFRYGWLLIDGTVAWLTRPKKVTVAGGGGTAAIQFSTAAYTAPFGDVDLSPVTGVAVYMSEDITSTPTYRDVIFYRAGVIPLNETSASYLFQESATTLPSRSLADETNLLFHTPRAGVADSYNQRLLLGDVQYDFRNVVAQNELTSGPGGTAYWVKLGVRVRTNKGIFERISDDHAPQTAASAAILSPSGFGLFAYPDRRVLDFRLYVSVNQGATYELYSTYEATALDASNLAVHESGTIDLTAITPIGTAMPTGTNTTYDRDPNRALVSAPFNPWSLPAGNALYTTKDDEDAILGFETNTLPTSEGQYGQAPVLVLGAKTVRALELGTSSVFSTAHPLALRGMVGRYAHANALGVVFFASKDGVWTLTPQASDRPVSAPLHSFESTADILSLLDHRTALEYIDDGRGHREVWVALGPGRDTYCYAPGYDTWFTVGRERSAIQAIGNSLYGYDTLCKEIAEEVQHVGDVGVDYRLTTAPLALDAPEFNKRLYRFSVRQRSMKAGDADYRGGMDQVNWALLDPIADTLSGTKNLDITVNTDIVGRLTAIGLLTVSATATVVDTTYVLSQVQGGLLGAGTMRRTIDSDTVNLSTGVCQRVVVMVTGTAKAGQGLVAFEFDYEPRHLHRARRSNR